MLKRRQTRAAIEKLNMQFIQYGITKPISYEEYIRIVDHKPMTRRELRQLFNGRWERLIKVLLKYYPNVYSQAVSTEAPAAPPVKEKETLLTIRNRWRNETADPSDDPYAGVNVAIIVNKHGTELAAGTDLERQYLRGALIEIWRARSAKNMDAAEEGPDHDPRWIKHNLGELTKSDKAHMHKNKEKKPSLGGLEPENKLSGLDSLRAKLGGKDE
jgi:hypothetical protein